MDRNGDEEKEVCDGVLSGDPQVTRGSAAVANQAGRPPRCHVGRSISGKLKLSGVDGVDRALKGLGGPAFAYVHCSSRFRSLPISL